ncbi:MAG: serine/threonine protein kinase, partial [Thermoleophilaceae bacterium]
MAAALALLGAAPAALAQEGPPARPDTRQVMFVGNNWDGTADIVDAHTFEHLARIDTIPDREERMREIMTSPDKLAFFLAIRQFVGEGNDQFTDDMFTSHDGRFVYVSRPSFADVVGIDLRTGAIVWRFPMEGYRSDHMAISPDGTRLLVSDSTANKVHELDARTG